MCVGTPKKLPKHSKFDYLTFTHINFRKEPKCLDNNFAFSSPICLIPIEKINLSDFFITSDAKIALNDQSFDKVIENKNVKGLKIIIKKAEGIKCIRCWKYFVNDKSVDKKLCKRCESVQNAI